MPPLAESQREALLAELGGLRKFCYSLTGNGADADDLLQTTVEKILDKEWCVEVTKALESVLGAKTVQQRVDLEAVGGVARQQPLQLRLDGVCAPCGDDGGEARTLAAGADSFLSKPLDRLSDFQQAVLRHLPPERPPSGPRIVTDERIEPDPIAYRDDMAHVAEVLMDVPDGANLDHIAQFLGGLARTAKDVDMASAAKALARARETGGATVSDVARIAGLVQSRLARAAAI